MLQGLRKYAATFVVAAVTAAAMASAPAIARIAGADRSAAGTTIPVIKSGFNDGPVQLSTNMTKIAALRLPKGSWAIFGKLYVHAEPNATTVQCELIAGAHRDASWVSLGSASIHTLALDVAHTFSTKGAVKLQCQDHGYDVNAWSIKITAIKAGTLANIDLS